MYNVTDGETDCLNPERPSPKVSIVLCVHNGHTYFGEMMEYLENQPFRDYELIIIVTSLSSDGSIDDAEQYCASHDNSSLIIQNERTFLGGAKNLGLDNAVGKYVWFLDIDDMPSFNYLSEMVSALESTDSQISVCNFVYSDKRVRPTDNKESELMVLTGSQAVHARSINLIPISSWSMLYDLNMVKSNGLRFSEAMSEDIGFTFKAFDCADRVCIVPNVIYSYYMNAESFCNSKMDERGMTESDAYQDLISYFPSSNSYLMRRLKLMSTRCLLHMSVSGFKQEIKDTRYKELYSTDMKFIDHIELSVARNLPGFYHWLCRVFTKYYYYKPGKIFMTSGKISTIRKIIGKS